MASPRATARAIELGPKISRNRVIERARSWLVPGVSYSQVAFHENEYGRYRTDCSGYVSMAWALPGKPPNRHGGLDTVGLASVSAEIGKDELRPGDVLLRIEGTNLTRHVVIFAAWAGMERAAYWGYEQAGGIGTTYRVVPYPYEHGAGHYRQYRYVHIND
jgi:cell wall-associated NlpC family hydrolase